MSPTDDAAALGVVSLRRSCVGLGITQLKFGEAVMSAPVRRMIAPILLGAGCLSVSMAKLPIWPDIGHAVHTELALFVLT
jgi:hypothetical protein